MQLGLLVAGAAPPDRLVGLARTARDAGFRRLWHADERFFRDPWPTLGHLAGAVPELDLGVGVTDPFVHHPALTARSAATLLEMAPGRFTLGLGAGVSGFSAMGIDRRRPVVAMRETIDLVRSLCRGETVDHAGEVVALHGGRLGFDARQAPPIHVATNGPKMLALAGEVADGVIVQGLASRTMIESVRDILREGARAAGRDADEIRLVARVDVAVDVDADAARARMVPGLVRHLAAHHPRYHSFALAGLEVPEELRGMVAELGYGFDRPGARAVAERVPAEWVDRFCLAGDAPEVERRVRDLREAGVDELLVHPVGGADSDLPELLDLLGRSLDRPTIVTETR